MTTVKIKHVFDFEAQHLAEVPFDELDSIIPTLKAWSINGDDVELSGQFVYSERGAYFLITIHEDGDGS